MKVLHIAEVFWPRIGGIETSLSTLFRNTPEINHVVLTNALDGLPMMERLSENVVVRRVPPDDGVAAAPLRKWPGSPMARRATRTATLLAHLVREIIRRRLIHRERPDIVHLHSAEKARHFLALDRMTRLRLGTRIVDWWLDASAFHAPLLLTDHSLFGASPAQFEATLGSEVVRRLPNVVCVEQSGYENVTAFASRVGLHIRVWYVPNPIDTDVFAATELPRTDRLIVGYVGRIEKEGLEEIRRLVAMIPEWLEFRLALAGKPRDLHSEWGVSSDRLAVRWNVPNEELPRFYEGIHVLLDPYSFGAPRTALEALATGRVVLRLREEKAFHEDLPETVSPIAEPTPEAVLRILADYRERPSELVRLARASRLLACEQFDARRVANEYRRIYGDLVRSRWSVAG